MTATKLAHGPVFFDTVDIPERPFLMLPTLARLAQQIVDADVVLAVSQTTCWSYFFVRYLDWANGALWLAPGWSVAATTGALVVDGVAVVRVENWGRMVARGARPHA